MSNLKIDQEEFNRKAQHILDTVVKPQVERYEKAKAQQKNKMTAVKICSISILLGLLTSCYDGEVNGRKFYLKKTCIKSHIEEGTRPQLAGKVWLYVPSSNEVCDKYKTDTIWETK